MKQNFLLIFLLFASYFLKAQTDSLHYKVLLQNINVYRASKMSKPINLSQGLNFAAEIVLKKGNTFKNVQGDYIKDSIRSEMRRNGIFDYNITILEKKKINNIGFQIGNKQSAEFEKVLSDKLINNIGIASNSGSEIIILTNHYVEIDPEFEVSLNAPPDGVPLINYALDPRTITIKGYTQLSNLNVNSFDLTKNIETNTPIDIFKIKKDSKNEFKIEIPISKLRQKIPKQLSITDSTGNILSFIPL